ncbi:MULTISPECIES: LysM peptidoglycan-binding domain-containing protein [Microbacterium]|uniref:LysM peptidoglycan-binding domain-containing protein n=1 Tax=Microbacterium sufflavum TaxID=2851649 RepID=A0ABY4IJ02_9MICO|nr:MULTISPECIES: LysM peptidoglycan-binding domain-containing protein [Microbacterium]MBN6192674.1 LysM peptidoglycan-binding domain-containing protein [Aneurinibacillus sp. BA2021]MCK2027861.1 LysM peptidoglycan-binding domain-containing protein [Microbacterium sufflavum]UPL12577.1 LysM peptidoglycan-binding domain-containing protein [Microbacterium sufflavum]
MSTISLSTATAISATARPATRLRLTARGRGVLLAVASVPLAVGIAFAAISGGSAIASGADKPVAAVETITVMPGDTLWSIAGSIAPEADPRDVIGDISRMNLLRGGEIQIGQELAIPAQYAE